MRRALGAGTFVTFGLSVLVAVALPLAGLALSDADGDGVEDGSDNCVNAANADQVDSDSDGYGNACDADYDNSGTVTVADLNALKRSFNSAAGDPNYDPAIDCDGDADVDDADFEFARDQFGGTPGPSGLGCAGTVPCSAN